MHLFGGGKNVWCSRFSACRVGAESNPKLALGKGIMLPGDQGCCLTHNALPLPVISHLSFNLQKWICSIWIIHYQFLLLSLLLPSNLSSPSSKFIAWPPPLFNVSGYYGKKISLKCQPQLCVTSLSLWSPRGGFYLTCSCGFAAFFNISAGDTHSFFFFIFSPFLL